VPAALAVGFLIVAASPDVRAANGGPTVFEMPLPGGLRGALDAVDDPVEGDRSQFLLEVIRRSFRSPVGSRTDARELTLRSLFAYLDKSASQGGTTDTLPLPLSPDIWTSVIFEGRATPQTLVSAILQSRGAAFFYYGALSLDDPTREWLAGQRDLIVEIVQRYPAAFLLAAPALRVADGAVRLPGGENAEPIWEALTGRRVNDPASFVRALLQHGEGRLAYFLGSLSGVAAPRLRFALNLDASDAAVRVDAGRRLYDVYQRLAPGWRIDDRTFSRPWLDPALLVSDLDVDASGRLNLPGTRRFWSAAFREPDSAPAKTKGRDDEPASLVEGDPVDFAWLSEEIFKADQLEQRRRYNAVLFASRTFDRVTAENAHDAVAVVRAATLYPALVAVLERAGLSSLPSYVAAVQRAADLSAIGDDARATRGLAQFQGALSLVARAATRGVISPKDLPEVISTLAAVPLGERGDYEARLTRWLDTFVHGVTGNPQVELPAPSDIDNNDLGPFEHDVVGVLSAVARREPRVVEWEGTRYRVDFAAAEAQRIERNLGEGPTPFLTLARTVADMADAIAAPSLTAETVRREATTLAAMRETLVLDTWEDNDARDRFRDAVSALEHAARDGNVRSAQTLAPALRVLTDDLTARGLTLVLYAAALGRRDQSSIVADQAAARHDFGLRSTSSRRYAPWRLPSAGGSLRGWHVTGSLLGLDVSLAEFSLVRLSSKPPKRRPTLNEDDRRALTEAVAIVDPIAIADDVRDVIVDAMQKGRTRLAALPTPEETAAIADRVHLSSLRRTLLAWLMTHDKERMVAFFSPAELMWIGLDGAPIARGARALGAPGGPRLGCFCLTLSEPRPWEMFAGRWSSGILATDFPDLNLRISELLAELHMPAALLAPVLASATLDFVNNASSRDPDDRRGLVEFVRALRRDRVEEYLALLTTEGPLVPLPQTSDDGRPRSER
jgi:hypothetical protein